MVRVKTLDKNYLATHPEGDEKADISLSASVPERMGLPLNPDGSRPQITINVIGATYLSVLQVLAALHDDPEPLLEGLVEELLTEAEVASFDSLEQAGPLINERFAEITVPFKTLTVSLNVGDEEVKVAITSPNATVGVQALRHLSSPSMVQSTAIAMSPELDDEDGYDSNEVLVMG